MGGDDEIRADGVGAFSQQRIARLARALLNRGSSAWRRASSERGGERRAFGKVRRPRAPRWRFPPAIRGRPSPLRGAGGRRAGAPRTRPSAAARSNRALRIRREGSRSPRQAARRSCRSPGPTAAPAGSSRASTMSLLHLALGRFLHRRRGGRITFADFGESCASLVVAAEQRRATGRAATCPRARAPTWNNRSTASNIARPPRAAASAGNRSRRDRRSRRARGGWSRWRRGRPSIAPRPARIGRCDRPRSPRCTGRAGRR